MDAASRSYHYDCCVSVVLHRSLPLVVFIVLALLAILNLGYWQEMLETFVLVFCSDNDFRINWRATWDHGSASPLVIHVTPTYFGFDANRTDICVLDPDIGSFGLGIVPGLISTIILPLQHQSD